MRIIHFKPLFIAAITLVLLCSIYIISFFIVATKNDENLREFLKLNVSQQVCRRSNLKADNHLIQKYIEDSGQLKCSEEIDWLKTDKGQLHFDSKIAEHYGKITCKLSYITRLNDFKNKKSDIITFTSDKDKDPIQLEQDFFTVKCNTMKNNKAWENVMLGIRRKRDVIIRAHKQKPKKASMGLNVLMFGFDSMSHLHYIRKLPKTYNYLTKVLNGTMLKGYNIVGDGTPQALIPILTGFTEPELPETRKRKTDAHYVNVYPFVWKNFSSNGYVTTYGEDQPPIGTFTYRLKGFKEPPTDHYMQPFYLAVENVKKDHPEYCLRNTSRHKIMLQYIRQFFDVYADVPKFSFFFHVELSHDNYNLIGYADDDLQYFLKTLHEDGILNNTLLILMSDHGHRFAKIRQTQQGKLEERMPFVSIVVPPWFEKKYPIHYRNLRLNSDRLTVPFDLYETFLTILNPNIPEVGDISKRGISLFSEIPKERSCADADVELHWCACLSWTSLSVSDPVAENIAQALVTFINDYTASHRNVCSTLFIDAVNKVEKMEPNLALLKFKKNADVDGFVGDFSDNTQISQIIYQVQLQVFPSLGIYEASMQYDLAMNSFILKEKDISRINTYDKQDHCIHDTFPYLSKYCYCKMQLSL